ncbi:MAG: methionyl-tRNA formyltransferase [Clostridia bacterium]|nr:methionyl-tRNA formyltransferase [Clostridia bacterium]
MKVVFMGTPDFAVGTLEAIVGAGHEVAAVVTQPDKPKGRGGVMAMSPVKECALRHGLTVLQPLKARNPEFIDKIKAINPDVIVVVAFGQIIPSEIIHMPKFGCINVHASLLPKYRGASPIQWTVLDGCEYSGVTTMLMDEGIDTGDILETATVKLDERETGGSLFDRLSLVGAKLLVETLDKAEAGQLHPVKQDDSQSSYVRMIDKSFGLMDFTQPVEVLERKVRALNPWPSAFTHMDEKLLKIWDATVIKDNNVKAGDYGKVKTDGKTCFMVACDGGYLSVNELQLEGKKRMKVEDFLRGYSIKEGTVLS